MMSGLNYSALGYRPTIKERVEAFKSIRVGEIKLLLLVDAIIITLGITTTIILLILGEGIVAVTVAILILPVPLLIFLAFLGVGYVVTGRVVRVSKFAKENNMTYRPYSPFDNRPGIVFSNVNSSMFSDLLIARDRQFTELGNYRFTVGSGRYRTTYTKGFARVKLPRRLPHMFLDSRSNSRFSGWLDSTLQYIKANQKTELEGDFGKYFTLYVPRQYEVDARYVFTPDVMQAMIEASSNYDCEIIDDDLYIFSTERVAIDSPKSIEELLAVIDTLKPELIMQTKYYSDERVRSRASNRIALKGSRLKNETTTLQALLKVIIMIALMATLPLAAWCASR